MPEFQGKAALHLSISGGGGVHGHSSSAEERRRRPPPEKGHVGFPGRPGGPGGLRINWLPAPSCGVLCGQF